MIYESKILNRQQISFTNYKKRLTLKFVTFFFKDINENTILFRCKICKFVNLVFELYTYNVEGSAVQVPRFE